MVIEHGQAEYIGPLMLCVLFRALFCYFLFHMLVMSVLHTILKSFMFGFPLSKKESFFVSSGLD